MKKKNGKIAIIYSRFAGQFECNKIELNNIKFRLFRSTRKEVLTFELEQLHEIPLQQFDFLVVMGGDGTVGRVLGWVASNESNKLREIPIGIIPAGTGNIFAECLGLMKRDVSNLIKNALDVIEEGITSPVDLGIANHHPFVIDVGVGPIATAITRPNTQEKFHFGMFSYMKPLFKSLMKRPYKFRLTTDNEVFSITASGVFISNPPDIGIGQNSTLEGLQDGYLNLCIMNPHDMDDYMKLAKKYGAWFIAGLTVDDIPYKTIKVKQAIIEALCPSQEHAPLNKIANFDELPLEELEINGTTQLKAMLDGDPFEFTPLEVSIIEKAVNVIVSPDTKTKTRIVSKKKELLI